MIRIVGLLFISATMMHAAHSDEPLSKRRKGFLGNDDILLTTDPAQAYRRCKNIREQYLTYPSLEGAQFLEKQTCSYYALEDYVSPECNWDLRGDTLKAFANASANAILKILSERTENQVPVVTSIGSHNLFMDLVVLALVLEKKSDACFDFYCVDRYSRTIQNLINSDSWTCKNQVLAWLKGCYPDHGVTLVIENTAHAVPPSDVVYARALSKKQSTFVMTHYQSLCNRSTASGKQVHAVKITPHKIMHAVGDDKKDEPSSR